LKHQKSLFDTGAVWWKAVCDFRNELHEHIEKVEKDQLRFQTGRLYSSLIKRIKGEATGKEQWVALFYCYRFVTDTSLHAGYDEARRLHGEEMTAERLSSPRSFCSCPVSNLDELLFRVDSIASWMEAQESFSAWLVFKEFHAAWHGTMDDRARAIQAFRLSQLPKRSLGKTQRVGTSYSNKPWTARQWHDVLEEAARLTEKSYVCTELERWVWWCYPVFKRCKWNNREVLGAASNRGIDFEKEKAGIDELIRFQKFWIRRGLRFVGRKQKRNRTPPLAKFVEHVVLPDSEKMWGSVDRSVFLPKKS
jgi:hypothetical protein